MTGFTINLRHNSNRNYADDDMQLKDKPRRTYGMNKPENVISNNKEKKLCLWNMSMDYFGLYKAFSY